MSDRDSPIEWTAEAHLVSTSCDRCDGSMTVPEETAMQALESDERLLCDDCEPVTDEQLANELRLEANELRRKARNRTGQGNRDERLRLEGQVTALHRVADRVDPNSTRS